jgi:hypothetical protein
VANRLFVTGAFVLVIAATLVAFLTIGPPSRARAVALDERRVKDLRSIAARLHADYGNTGGILPPVLSGARDPITQQPYSYRRLSARRYELCATFATASESAEEATPNTSSWRHHAGRTCYERDIGENYPFE